MVILYGQDRINLLRIKIDRMKNVTDPIIENLTAEKAKNKK